MAKGKFNPASELDDCMCVTMSDAETIPAVR